MEFEDSVIATRSKQITNLREMLGASSQHTLFGLVDAAADENLYGWLMLEPKSSEVVCLYDGGPSIRYARYAPYLIVINAQSPLFTRWMDYGWQRHWGIWLTSHHPNVSLKRHLKRFLTLVHEGKTAYLRYYDPRVLPNLLKAMTPNNRHDFFGGDVIARVAAPQPSKRQLWLGCTAYASWLERAADSAKLEEQLLNI